MSGIRGKNTRPELVIRSGLHRLGFRFRLHVRDLPGKPDLVLPKYRAVIFVNGCFWHGHDCHLFKWPGTRRKFWNEKISANRRRDDATMRLMHESEWRTCVVWECSLKGRNRRDPTDIMKRLEKWIRSQRRNLRIVESN